MPCISFIVPVYNMERLLPRALRSLRAQTLTDFEAILINDGSKDGSAALCAQAVAEDARFRFIDQPNGGVATARNAGLDAARGEYIFFLDPDDWVEPDAAEVLYHAARNADADCVEFGLYLDSYDENDRLLHTQTSGSTLSGVYRGAPFKEHFDETASSYLVTNKLFRRAFLEQHQLRFSCHQLGEDGLFFVAFYRQNPGCLVVLEKPLYHYTAARRGSLSNSYHPERLEDNFLSQRCSVGHRCRVGLTGQPHAPRKGELLHDPRPDDGNQESWMQPAFPFRADCLAAQYPAKAPGAHGGAQHPTARHAEPERPGKAVAAQAAAMPRGAAALGRKSA